MCFLFTCTFRFSPKLLIFLLHINIILNTFSMKKLAFFILGFCLISFYLLRNLKLFPSSSVFWNWNTPPLHNDRVCNDPHCRPPTSTRDHHHRRWDFTGIIPRDYYEVAHWKGARQWFFFTFVLQLTRRKSMLLVVSSSVDASGPDATSQSETTSKIDPLEVNCSPWLKRD